MWLPAAGLHLRPAWGDDINMDILEHTINGVELEQGGMELDVSSPSMPAPSGRSGQSSAPVYTVPAERIVSIEHPCIVRNFDNGMKSMGGEAQIKHVSQLLSGV